MSNIFLVISLVLTFTVSKATEKEIKAEVVFENLTDRELHFGEFFITETYQRIEVKDTNGFTVTLPREGKYQFTFLTVNFDVKISYPNRITHKNNIITIKLLEKTELTFDIRTLSFPMNLETNLTDEQIEQRIVEGSLNFIMHAIDSYIPKEFDDFKEKYGVGLIKENCIIDPISFKKATEHNQMIYNYLIKKHGNIWINELMTKPFGIK